MGRSCGGRGSNLFCILLWGLVCTPALNTSAHAVSSRQLRTLNNTAIKSIRSSNGGVIDCILLTKQPAFEHPLLKHHKLQRAPTAYPHRLLSHTQSKVSQLWHENGSCHNGTIPVRRTTADDILRGGSRKGVYGPKFYGAPEDARPDVFQGVVHEYAIGSTSDSNAYYYGTQAIFSLWDPKVEQPNEFSLSQLWVTAGSYTNMDLNTIEAGWQVSQGMYGDSYPHLFVYWTSDAYTNTGCYDLKCSGFVQTSNTIAVGEALSPISVENGEQSELTFHVFKDQAQGNWWLQLNGEDVGYWPQSIFTVLSDSATMVQWGGEIVNRETNGQHTTTQMGSGQFAEAGYKEAAYIRNLELVDAGNTLQSVANPQLIAENFTCYDIVSAGITDPKWGSYFFFGGPGQNPNCP